MKKIIIAAAVALTFVSSAWAAETVNAHDQVKNAQAMAHQNMSTTQGSAVQGSGVKMADMDEHGKAAMSHETMKNGSAPAHQDMAKMHKKMMDDMAPNDKAKSKTFAEMDEHEKAAVVHEKANNGQSSAIHQQQAERHRSQVKTN